LVADTSAEGDDDTPLWIMQGYAILAEEVFEELVAPPTHVFVQGGVGGLAAALTAHFWEAYGPNRPRMIVVEPDKAACLMLSARSGTPRKAEGPLDTIMAGLACGEVSPIAFRILLAGAHAFLSVADEEAIEAMRMLALGKFDPPLIVGESGAAGLAGLLACAFRRSRRDALALGAEARVLLIATEGATDPDLYERLVLATSG
jgi:diaminopropionate ammonia-lyase